MQMQAVNLLQSMTVPGTCPATCAGSSPYSATVDWKTFILCTSIIKVGVEDAGKYIHLLAKESAVGCHQRNVLPVR